MFYTSASNLVNHTPAPTESEYIEIGKDTYYSKIIEIISKSYERWVILLLNVNHV